MNTTERRKRYTPEQIKSEREYRRRYAAENKEVLAQRARERRQTGKAKSTTYYRQRMTPEQREAERAKKREHYQRNREAALAYATSYREANRARLAEQWRNPTPERVAYLRDYYDRNRDRIAARTTAWRERNKDRIAQVQAQYLQNNLDRHRAHQQNRRARKKANGGRLSPDIVSRLFDLQRGRCACCGRPLGDDFDLDHIVPLALGGANDDQNVQLLRQRCNRIKGAKHPVTYMQSLGLLL